MKKLRAKKPLAARIRAAKADAIRAKFKKACAARGFAQPICEFTFHPTRLWRFDYAWPECWVALEVEGGIFSGGRHTRGAGFLKDMEKYNEATRLGWRVLRCTPSTLLSDTTLSLVAGTL